MPLSPRRPLPSTRPVWPRAAQEPQRVVLRVYALPPQTGIASCQVGSYVRAPRRAHRCCQSCAPAGGAWSDLGAGARAGSDHFSACCVQRGEPIELRRGGIELPSRVADNLYWLGRYVERAEQGAGRLLRGVASRLTAEAGLAGTTAFPTLLRPLRDTWRLTPVVDGAEASLATLEQACSPSCSMPSGRPVRPGDTGVCAQRGFHRT